MEESVLELKGLKVRFYTYEGVVKAIEGVDLVLKKGEILGLAGETGCGKSVTLTSILNLIPSPGRVESGKAIIKKDGKSLDIYKQSEKYLCRIRGKEISMVFQEPRAALNPVYTVEEHIAEVLLNHRKAEMIEKAIEQLKNDLESSKNSLKRLFYKIQLNLLKKMLENPDNLQVKIAGRIPIINRYKRRIRKEVRKEIIKILKEMELPDPERVANAYPHELSGGMAQRVVIAMALSCNPIILLADEPTTSLDVTVEAQILELIKRLRQNFGSSIIYVTHDLGVIAELCERVAIMYAGYICEAAPVIELFKKPLHPYTKGLLESIPRPDKPFQWIPGVVPSLVDPPPGCRFHPRCKFAMDICQREEPKLIEIEKDHFVSCHLIRRS